MVESTIKGNRLGFCSDETAMQFIAAELIAKSRYETCVRKKAYIHICHIII